MADAGKSKFNWTMLAFPVMFFAVKKVNFQDPEVVKMAQIGFCTMIAALFGIYSLISSRIKANPTAKKVVWMPPPENPAGWMAKLLGQEVPAAGNYAQMTIEDFESKKVQEAIQQLLMTGLMVMVMSFYFKVHPALVMQGVLLPINSTNNPVVRKYIFGQTVGDDGVTMYGEKDTEPEGNGTVATATTATESDKDAPRVEIISEETKAPEKAAAVKESKPKSNADLKQRISSKKSEIDSIDE